MWAAGPLERLQVGFPGPPPLRDGAQEGGWERGAKVLIEQVLLSAGLYSLSLVEV